MSNGFSALVLLEIKSAEMLKSELVERVGQSIACYGIASETPFAVARADLECTSLNC